MTDGVQSDQAKKDAPKKQYSKADITNSADKLIRKELDDADGLLEKVILQTLTLPLVLVLCILYTAVGFCFTGLFSRGHTSLEEHLQFTGSRFLQTRCSSIMSPHQRYRSIKGIIYCMGYHN